MRSGSYFNRGLMLICALSLIGSTQLALADNRGPLTLRGFGTLGLVHNPSDKYEFIRDLSQPRGTSDGVGLRTDSLFGLQLQYRQNDQFDAVMQVVSRYTYTGNFRPRLTWAYLRYAPNPDLQFRVGRMSADVFMFSDSRNVGYSHVWVRPPIEYFGLQTFSHIDGADAEYRRQLGPGLAWAKLYFDRADEKAPSEGDADLNLTDSLSVGGNLNYQLGAWWLRLGATTTKLKHEAEQFEPLIAALRASGSPMADRIGLKDARITHYSAGVSYERGAFQSQIMLAHGESDTLTIPNHTMGYFMASYRLGDWRPYVSYSAITSPLRRDTGFPSGHPLGAAVQQIFNSTHYKQRTAAIGLRHDFAANAALKFQVERLRAHSAAFVRRDEPDWDGRGLIFSVALDFIF